MDYLKIFEEVVSIMHNDYAGVEEKKDWDKPDFYRQIIQEAMFANAIDDSIFYDYVFNYLADFRDDHVLFRHKFYNYQKIGFYVRRYNDALYVTKITNDQIKIKKGMKIIRIDNLDLSFYENKYSSYFKNRANERQIWQFVLQRANRVTISDLEEEREISVEKNVCLINPINPYEIKLLDNNLVYMRFEDFNNPDQIYDLINANRLLLENSDYWVIDVRFNSGGSDNAYTPLLPYLFNQDERIFNEDVFFLMSERNCQLRLEILEEFIAKGSQKPETKKMIDDYIKYIRDNWGRGFVKYTDESAIVFKKDYFKPKKVVILTDVFCSSSGDQFVYDCRQSKKVHVIGRPTLGVIDYSNLARISLNDSFELWYPTSKTANVMRNSFLEDGVKPDTYIAWNPKHINQDVDLIEAIKHLNSTEK
jgi:C-terminal processing protease CtpA/Prc